MTKSSDTRIGLPRSVVGWIYNHSRKHYWRVAAWYELEDLIQDGLMIAFKCREYYGRPVEPNANRVSRVRLGEVDTPHFMALVQSAFHNHIGNLIRKKRAVDDTATKLDDLSLADKVSLNKRTEEAMTEFYMLVSQMPDHLRRAVLLYFTDEGAAALRRLRVRLHHTDDTLTDRIRALVGFPEGSDFETELRAWLWEWEHLC